jgi:GcrA cell cycle regulator
MEYLKMKRSNVGAAPWSPERVQKLRELFDQGLSCRDIANELGSVSRNAVIGKLTRLGLTRGAAARQKPAKRARARRAKSARPIDELTKDLQQQFAITRRRAAVPVFKAIEISDLNIEIAAARVSLIDATKDQCRYPAADDGSAIMVCGAPVREGSYCIRHVPMIRKRAA